MLFTIDDSSVKILSRYFSIENGFLVIKVFIAGVMLLTFTIPA